MRKNCILPFAIGALCLLLTGCQGEVEMQPDKSESLMNIEIDLNGYNTYSDVNFQENIKELGFEAEVPLPDSFTIAGETFTKDDFASTEALCNTLERLNTVATLNLSTWEGNLMGTNNPATVFEEALKQRNYSCNFYFNPNSKPVTDDETIPGILGVIVNRLNDVAIVCVEFNGENSEPENCVLLTYDEQQVNVMKTTTAGLTQWQVGAFDVEPIPMEQPEPVEVPTEEETPIDPESMYLDTTIDPVPEKVDDNTYTGVIYLATDQSAVHASDITEVNAAISAIMRMSVTMNTYIGPSKDDLLNLGVSLSPMQFEQLLRDEGSVYVEMYDFATNTLKVTAELTADKLILTAYPTGRETAPGTIVCYDTEYIPYVPYQFNHQMVIEFSTAEN